MSRSELKQMSKEQIKGNILTILIITIIISVITGIIAAITGVNIETEEPTGKALVGSLLIYLFTFGATFSLVMIFMNITNGKKAEIADLSLGFKRYKDAFCVSFLMAIYTFLWSLLFVIPGIVKTFSYAAAPYILAANPGMGANEAITKSRELMDGHKMDLFVLEFSFILWGFLVCITFGLAAIYVYPYMNTTVANFMKDLGAYGGDGSVVETAPQDAVEEE